MAFPAKIDSSFVFGQYAKIKNLEHNIALTKNKCALTKRKGKK